MILVGNPLNLSIQHFFNTWNEFATFLMQNPKSLIESQINFWNDYQSLFTELKDTAQFINSNNIKQNSNNGYEFILQQFINKTYILITEYLNNLADQLTKTPDSKLNNKIKFYTRQYIDALSPANFPHLNPEIMAKTLQSNGVNLINGMKQFVEDIIEGRGQLNIKNSDLSFFMLGKNIAYTRGHVIFQNEVMQLIQYTPSTKTIYQNPLLIIPPWINKYYILDLQHDNSFIKWLVDKGMTVFVISWVNPNNKHRHLKFSDYLTKGPIAALNTIDTIVNHRAINLLGYCIGGTLLGCLLSYLAKKKPLNKSKNSKSQTSPKIKINSATFLTTLFDFSSPGELGIFIDEEQITTLEQHMQPHGYMDGKIMATVFNALRANDLIWSAFVNNYLKGDAPKPFDLLYWNADSTHIPHQVQSYYLRNMYLDNLLVKPNRLQLCGAKLNLGDIKVPGYFLAAQDDHIVPWQSAYNSMAYYGGEKTFVLTTSGHVAGVINPPHKNKYQYYTNASMPTQSENFISASQSHSGSWWVNWFSWIKPFCGKKLTIAQALNTQKLKIIEPAPGSYARTTTY